MIRCQSGIISIIGKISRWIEDEYKEDLKQMAKYYVYLFPKLRKDEYATYFAEAVLACLDMWLPRLTQYELTLLDKVGKAGTDTL